ncbi:MurR/RpiR family transcriptional regulator [Paracidovorax konjaci]|uniref:DNA-binding transcriptional regulator, MurR/RpiR family, contains HTH and SIS domains n=1 Tax=Paracidovorax konjaci TaxID=32040 RepID=A0A1I1XAN3_9BURK|nr:MurR/RpiR family transcriptional regulator [Paracidovorax konjaci]SFE04211.1 DNA-binding transcriptional regulator, MurR/RpiR family, contains HTH and SIS domains [Paracidovorax konjaci]
MLLTERLAAQASTLTASERALADDLLRHYPDGLLDSASAIAARTGTSASTVVRMFAKLGYGSLAEVRREARSVVTSRLQTAAQRAPATLGGTRSLEECLEDALLHDQHNLAATRRGLDMPTFEAVARVLAESPGRVFVMAEKNSMPVSGYLAIHLNMCRPQVHELGSGAPFAVDRMLWIEPADVLLVFTVRRYSNGALLAARHFRERGATVLAVTDSPVAPIVPHAHHSLVVHTANASPFDSYTAAFFLDNALVSAVAQLRRSEVGQALERRDALWKRFESDALDGLRL